MTSIVRFSRCNRKKRKQSQETLCCTNAGCYRKENSCPGLHCGPLIIAKTLHTVLFAQPSRKAKQTEGSETLKGTMVPPSPAPLTQRQVRVNGQLTLPERRDRSARRSFLLNYVQDVPQLRANPTHRRAHRGTKRSEVHERRQPIARIERITGP